MDTHLALPLLGGMTADRFMQRHWQRKPLLIRQAIPGFVAPLDRAALFALAETRPITGRQLLQGLTDAAADLGLLPAQRQNAAQGLRVRGLPWGAMRLMGLVSPMMRELVRMRYLWTRPHALSGSRLAQQAGPLRSTPPAVALRQALLDLNPGAAGHAKALSSRRAAA